MLNKVNPGCTACWQRCEWGKAAPSAETMEAIGLMEKMLPGGGAPHMQCPVCQPWKLQGQTALQRLAVQQHQPMKHHYLTACQPPPGAHTQMQAPGLGNCSCCTHGSRNTGVGNRHRHHGTPLHGQSKGHAHKPPVHKTGEGTCNMLAATCRRMNTLLDYLDGKHMRTSLLSDHPRHCSHLSIYTRPVAA